MNATSASPAKDPITTASNKILDTPQKYLWRVTLRKSLSHSGRILKGFEERGVYPKLGGNMPSESPSRVL